MTTQGASEGKDYIRYAGQLGMLVFSHEGEFNIDKHEKIEFPPVKCNCGDCLASNAAKTFIARGHKLIMFIPRKQNKDAAKCTIFSRPGTFIKRFKPRIVKDGSPEAAAAGVNPETV